MSEYRWKDYTIKFANQATHFHNPDYNIYGRMLSVPLEDISYTNGKKYPCIREFASQKGIEIRGNASILTRTIDGMNIIDESEDPQYVKFKVTNPSNARFRWFDPNSEWSICNDHHHPFQAGESYALKAECHVENGGWFDLRFYYKTSNSGWNSISFENKQDPNASQNPDARLYTFTIPNNASNFYGEFVLRDSNTNTQFLLRHPNFYITHSPTGFDFTMTKVKSQNYFENTNFDNLINSKYKYTAGMNSDYQFNNGSEEYDGKHYLSFGHSSREFENGRADNSKSNDLTIRETMKGYNMYILEWNFFDEHRNLIGKYGDKTIWINNMTYSYQGTGKLGYAWRIPVEMIQAHPTIFGKKYRLYDSTFNDRDGKNFIKDDGNGYVELLSVSGNTAKFRYYVKKNGQFTYVSGASDNKFTTKEYKNNAPYFEGQYSLNQMMPDEWRESGLDSTSHYQQMYDYFNKVQPLRNNESEGWHEVTITKKDNEIFNFFVQTNMTNKCNNFPRITKVYQWETDNNPDNQKLVIKNDAVADNIINGMVKDIERNVDINLNGGTEVRRDVERKWELYPTFQNPSSWGIYYTSKNTSTSGVDLDNTYTNILNSGSVDISNNGSIAIAYIGGYVQYTDIFTSVDFYSTPKDKYGESYEDIPMNVDVMNTSVYVDKYGSGNKRLMNIGDWGWGPHNDKQIKMVHPTNEIFQPAYHTGFFRMYMSMPIFNDKAEWRDTPQLTVDIPFNNLNVYDSNGFDPRSMGNINFTADTNNETLTWNFKSKEPNLYYNIEKFTSRATLVGKNKSQTYAFYPERWVKNYTGSYRPLLDLSAKTLNITNDDYHYDSILNENIENAKLLDAQPFSNNFMLNGVERRDVQKWLDYELSIDNFQMYSKQYNYTKKADISESRQRISARESEHTRLIYVLSNNSNLNENSPRLNINDIRNNNVNERYDLMDKNIPWRIASGSNTDKALYLYIRLVPDKNNLVDYIAPSKVIKLPLPNIFDRFEIVSDQWLIYEGSPQLRNEPTDTFVSIPVEYSKDREIDSIFAQAWVIDYWKSSLADLYKNTNPTHLEYAKVNNGDELILKAHEISTYTNGNQGLNGHSAFYVNVVFTYKDRSQSTYKSPIYYENITLSTFGTKEHFIAARFPIELVTEFPDHFSKKWSIDRVLPQPYSQEMERDFYLEYIDDGGVMVNDNGHNIQRHNFRFNAFRKDGKLSGVPIDALDTSVSYFPTDTRTTLLNDAYDAATNQALGLYKSMQDSPDFHLDENGKFILDGFSDVAVGTGALGMFITNGYSSDIANDSRFTDKNTLIPHIIGESLGNPQKSNLLYNTYELSNSGLRNYIEYGSLSNADMVDSTVDEKHFFRGLRSINIKANNGGLPLTISSMATNIQPNKDYLLQAWVKMSNVDQHDKFYINSKYPLNKADRIFNNRDTNNWIQNNQWFPVVWEVSFSESMLKDSSPNNEVKITVDNFDFGRSNIYMAGWTLQEKPSDKEYAPYTLGDIELLNFNTRAKTNEYYGVELPHEYSADLWKNLQPMNNAVASVSAKTDMLVNMFGKGRSNTYTDWYINKDIYIQSKYDTIVFSSWYTITGDGLSDDEVDAKLELSLDGKTTSLNLNNGSRDTVFLALDVGNTNITNLKNRLKLRVSSIRGSSIVELERPVILLMNKDIRDGYWLYNPAYNPQISKRNKLSWTSLSSGRLNNIDHNKSYDIDDFNLWMEETPRIVDPMVKVSPNAKLDKTEPLDTFKVDKNNNLSIIIDSGYEDLVSDNKQRWAVTLHSFTNTTNVRVSGNGKDGSSQMKFIPNYKSGTTLDESGTYYVSSKNELRYYNPLRFNKLVTFSSQETDYSFDYYKEYVPPHLSIPTINSEEQSNSSVNVIVVTHNDDLSKNYRYEYSYTLNGGPRVNVNGKQISSENVGKENETNIWNFTEKGDYVFYVHYANDDFPDGAEINTVFTIGNGNIHYGGDDGYDIRPGEYPKIKDYPVPQDWIAHDSYPDDDNAFYNDIRYHSPWFDMKKEIRTINIFGKRYAIDPNIDYNVFDNSIFNIDAYKSNYPYYNDHIHTIGENILTTNNKYFNPEGLSRTENELDISKKAEGHNHLSHRSTNINMIDQTKPVTPEYIATSDTALPPWESHKDMPLASTNDITFRLQNPSTAYDCKCYIDGKEYTPGTKYTTPGTHWFYAIYRDKHNYLVSYSQPQKFIIENEVFYSPPFIDYMPKRIYSEFYDVTVDYFFYDHQLGMNDEENDKDELNRPRVKQKLYKLGENDTWKEYSGKIRITKPTVIYARKVYTDNYHFDVSLNIDFSKFNYDKPAIPDISDIGRPNINGGNISVYIPTVQKKLGYMYREWLNGIPYTPGIPITNYERNRRKFFYTVEVTNVINMEKTRFTKVFYIDTRAPERPRIKGLIQGMIVNWNPDHKFELENTEKDVSYTFTINGKPLDINQPLSHYYNEKTNTVYKIIAQARRNDNNMANTSIYYIDLNNYSTTPTLNQVDKPRNVLLPYNRDNNYFEYPGELIVNSRTGDLSIVSDVSKGDGSYKTVDVTENISSMLRISSNAIGAMFKTIPILNEKLRWLNESYKFINANNNWLDNFYNQLNKDINDLYKRLQNLDKSSSDNEKDIVEMKKELDRQREIVMTGEFHNAYETLNTTIRKQLPELRERYINFMKDYYDIANVVAMSYYNLDNINELANKKVTVDQFNRWAKQIIDYGHARHNEFNQAVDNRTWLDPTDFGFNNPYF